MQALWNFVSPNPKRVKTSAPLELSDSEDEMEEEMVEQEKPPPGWVAGQNEMMYKMMDMIKELQVSLGNIKEEVAQSKFQAGVAQTIAEEALEKVEDLETRIFQKLDTLEAMIPNKLNIQNMINDMMPKARYDSPKPAIRKSTNLNGESYETVSEEKFSRTLVIGSFERDTPKKQVVDYIEKNIIKDKQHVEEVFAYNFGSVGFVRFQSRDAMFGFLKRYNMEANKPLINNRQAWVTTSKTPEERTKAKHLSKLKKVLIDIGLAVPDNVTIDYKRGIAFVDRVRVAEWDSSGAVGRMVIKQENLKDAKIEVAADKIHDAVGELLQE